MYFFVSCGFYSSNRLMYLFPRIASANGVVNRLTQTVISFMLMEKKLLRRRKQPHNGSLKLKGIINAMIMLVKPVSN